ncbi:molybdopterin molybdotransferase MoeA [Streptomyces sp. NPDC088757]|uniref:molybdopterin molybdotransferase MoeA n=1 Tax=Streptomyces sp. NPDC088757 TaxID=3365889 RepID=UPI00380485C6
MPHATTPAEPAPPLADRQLSGGAVSWDEARRRAHAAAAPAPGRHVPLHAAPGHTLAEDLLARGPLPSFDTAAMDGFAVAGRGPWVLRGSARAGAPWPGRLGPGHCVGISTGAPVPPGASAVLPLEAASVTAGRVSGPGLADGRHIRRTGEDAAAGDRLAPAGTRVGPALVGLAATGGHDTLLVRPRPRVTVLVTGDELDRTGVPAAGRVRDALGPLLPALVAELGAETASPVYVRDRPGELARKIGNSSGTGTTGAADTAGAARPTEAAGITVVTGSTSVGPTDQLRRLLADGGARMVVDTVACRPGHPMLLAELSPARWVVGLPGNPYAALVAARTLLGPLVAGLSGRRPGPLVPVPVHGRVKPAPGRTRLVPVAWDGDGCRIVGGHRAAFLRGAACGDALAALGPDWTDGAPAPVLLPGT